MPSTDITVEIVNWAMRLEQLRAETASRNIAVAGLPGAQVGRLDFADKLASMRAVLQVSGDPDASIQSALSRPMDAVPVAVGESLALDDEVTELAESELRYRALAEGVTRQLSLLSLAASAKQ